MIKDIFPLNKITGSFHFDGDKSISHRAALLPLVSKKLFSVSNLSLCDDVKRSIKISELLGVTIAYEKDRIVLDSSNIDYDFSGKKPLELYCGNSGTTARLICGILANFKGKFIITGDDSLSKRPMNRVTVPLTKMGLDIKCSENGTLPITINSYGKNHPIIYYSKECSAQVKSAIQLASLACGKASEISEPYLSRDHTERLLNFLDRNKQTKEIKMDIPSDPSSAAYFAGATALLPFSEVILKDVLLNPTRTAVFEVLKEMGAKVDYAIKNDSWEARGDIIVKSGELLHPVNIDSKQIPALIDEIPLLAVLMAKAHGTSTVRGAKELRYKESDRISTIIRELKKIGVECEEYDDGFSITGPAKIKKNYLINTEKDHRIVMSFSILALASDLGLSIDNSECVSISFPDFFEKIFTN